MGTKASTPFDELGEILAAVFETIGERLRHVDQAIRDHDAVLRALESRVEDLRSHAREATP